MISGTGTGISFRVSVLFLSFNSCTFNRFEDGSGEGPAIERINIKIHGNKFTLRLVANIIKKNLEERLITKN